MPNQKEEKINLIVRSNIRKAMKDKIANVAEEVEEALNNKVHEILDDAVERAKANQRRTLHARDL
jgi:histone H3/H4